MSTNTTELVDAIARHLAALKLVRYEPTGAYKNGTLPAVFVGQLPDRPDDAVSIRVYDRSRDRDRDNPDWYVQLRFRRAGRDPRPVDDFADAVDAALDDRSHFTLPGGIGVKLCRCKIRGVSDPDDSGRWSRPDSYVFTLDAKAST